MKHQTTATFLISKDCNTLARLEKFDISKDPALAINVDGRPVRGEDTAKVEKLPGNVLVTGDVTQNPVSRGSDLTLFRSERFQMLSANNLDPNVS
jgi:hypothetical protein